MVSGICLNLGISAIFIFNFCSLQRVGMRDSNPGAPYGKNWAFGQCQVKFGYELSSMVYGIFVNV